MRPRNFTNGLVSQTKVKPPQPLVDENRMKTA